MGETERKEDSDYRTGFKEGGRKGRKNVNSRNEERMIITSGDNRIFSLVFLMINLLFFLSELRSKKEW